MRPDSQCCGWIPALEGAAAPVPKDDDRSCDGAEYHGRDDRRPLGVAQKSRPRSVSEQSQALLAFMPEVTLAGRSERDCVCPEPAFALGREIVPSQFRFAGAVGHILPGRWRRQMHRFGPGVLGDRHARARAIGVKFRPSHGSPNCF